MPENPTTALVKTRQSSALARVSSQLALTDKLLAKTEEPFLIPYRKGNKWGYCDRNKNIVIDCIYDRTYAFEKGIAFIELGHKLGFINNTGEIITKIFYDDFGVKVSFDTNDSVLDNRLHHSGNYFSEELAFINKHNKYGFINSKGSLAIQLEFDDATSFSEGLAAVKLNNKWGFISKWGKVIIPFQYSSVRSFSSGLAVVGLSIGFSYETGRNIYQYGYINKEGVVVIPIQFSYADSFYEDKALIRTSSNGPLVYIDKNNEMEFIAASEKLLFIKYGDKLKIEPDEFSKAGYFSDGLAAVCSRKGQFWGYIDQHGEVQIPLKYSYATPFSEGMAGVKKNEMYGYINRFDEEVLPFLYKYAGPFINGLAVALGNKSTNGYVTNFNGLIIHGYIDRNGTEYWED